MVRVRLRQRQYLLSDVLLVLGAICALGVVISNSITYSWGLMYVVTAESEKLNKVPSPHPVIRFRAAIPVGHLVHDDEFTNSLCLNSSGLPPLLL